LCIDKAEPKRKIVEDLLRLGKAFIDVGMGVSMTDRRSLSGLLRTTLSTEECRVPRHPIGFGDLDNDYALNIQIADLNALNAALAVIRWKQYLTFYEGDEKNFSSVYTLNFNRIDNAGCKDAS